MDSQNLTAGQHEFPLRLLNFCNPHNTVEIPITAQIVSTYVEVVVDPESSGKAIAPKEQSTPHQAFLPPVTVPPGPDNGPHGPNFWFTMKNVYDEDLNIKMTAKTRDHMAECVFTDWWR